jgi:hypothetical protein
MRIAYQWLTVPATDWRIIEAADWAGIAVRPPPPLDRRPVFDASKRVIGFTGSTLSIDGTEGLVSSVNVQGQPLSGDWVAVEPRATGVHVHIDVSSEVRRQAIMVWEFLPEWETIKYRLDARRSASFVGPRQTCTIYADSWPFELGLLSGGRQVVRPFAEHAVNPLLKRYSAWVLSSDWDSIDAFRKPELEDYWDTR